MPPMAVDSGAGAAKPKKAASAYFLYASSIRAGLIEESRKANCGKAKLPDVAKKISELWSQLADSEKAQWDEKAKEGKEKQAAEMKAYKDASDPLSALKEKYAELIPKKPPSSAFWIYNLDPSERSKAEKVLKDAGEEASYKIINKKIAEIWKALSESEKEPWNEKLKKLTTEYEEKRKIWEATPEFVEFSKLEKEQKDAAKEQKAKEKAEEKEAAKEEKKAAKEAEKEEKKAAKETKKAAKESPKKREAGKEDSSSSPPAKKAKVEKPTKAGKKAKPQDLEIEADVLKKAQGLGLESSLRNLMNRPDVMDKGFEQAHLLQVLEKNEGLVNKAKYVLLGA
eukprot:gnl/MRDRNA2_/MRDRNA2_60267_c0_seq1.p1 gnl/MRDRNA2_/MRDRNA2_60267_c0~~gnl/MRDRNA2_/MRDRNA2_60267_c0_seq1.p1  ORF type:complete len:340 (+),score=150.03 gnl/MRDRNA2_/MRDRNA2_60267_c0_seq1:90-1109(+)